MEGITRRSRRTGSSTLRSENPTAHLVVMNYMGHPIVPFVPAIVNENAKIMVLCNGS